LDLKNTGYDVAYDHIGIPTIHPSEGEVYQADISAHVYRVGTDGLRIEKIRFDTDAPFPQDVKTRPHIAFKVDDLAEAIFGKQIVMPPTEFKPGIQFAFVDIEGTLIEFFKIG
tara:strand:- start:696 stop:1034 length:339 start_codon:yes stop_codon:yes gene_type:complete